MELGQKTVVLGASTNPERTSFLATQRLIKQGIETVPVGIREGAISGVAIQQGTPAIEAVDTVTLYLNPTRQKAYYDYILGLKPKRIIFNPGTENYEFAQQARAAGIEAQNACTLVLLPTQTY